MCYENFLWNRTFDSLSATLAGCSSSRLEMFRIWVSEAFEAHPAAGRKAKGLKSNPNVQTIQSLYYLQYMFKLMSCLLVQIVYQTSILNIYCILPLRISRFQWSPFTALQPIWYFLPACPADRRSWHRRSAPTSCQRVRYGCQRVL